MTAELAEDWMSRPDWRVVRRPAGFVPQVWAPQEDLYRARQNAEALAYVVPARPEIPFTPRAVDILGVPSPNHRCPASLTPARQALKNESSS
jgi:hypothetical protein